MWITFYAIWLETTTLLEVVRTICKNYIKKIDSKWLFKEIANNKKEDNKKKLKYLENKTRKYILKIDMLYEDKFRGSISDIAYKRLSIKT